MKKKRTKSRENIEDIMEIPCLCCNSPHSEAHHIKTRGSGAGDDLWNLMPLCRIHHAAIHAMGLNRATNKYPQICDYLVDLGWHYCDITNKYWHPDNV